MPICGVLGKFSFLRNCYWGTIISKRADFTRKVPSNKLKGLRGQNKRAGGTIVPPACPQKGPATKGAYSLCSLLISHKYATNIWLQAERNVVRTCVFTWITASIATKVVTKQHFPQCTTMTLDAVVLSLWRHSSILSVVSACWANNLPTVFSTHAYRQEGIFIVQSSDHDVTMPLYFTTIYF